MARESLPGHLKRPDYEGADPSYTFFVKRPALFPFYPWAKSGLFHRVRMKSERREQIWKHIWTRK